MLSFEITFSHLLLDIYDEDEEGELRGCLFAVIWHRRQLNDIIMEMGMYFQPIEYGVLCVNTWFDSNITLQKVHHGTLKVSGRVSKVRYFDIKDCQKSGR